ncbi:MAG: efflux RND transporter permease subunit [Sandaracinaceae bacterium]|nr:efflux RND transporter permease subunit [Sandaracinaceae bacterium]
MIEYVVRACVRHAYAVLAATVLLAVVGTYAARGVTLDALPDVTSNQVIVLTLAQGFAPEEIEQRVTTPIELAIVGVPGLAEVRSISRYGISSVTAVFDDTVAPLSARQQITERLQGVRERLPAGVDAPELAPLTGGLGEIVHFALTSDLHSQLELSEIARYRVGPALRRVPGVVEVNSWGGGERAISLTVDVARLADRHLTLAAFSEQIRLQLGVAPGGSIHNGVGQLLLRGLARPQGVEDVAALRVLTDSGDAVRVGDLARIEETMRPRLGAATFNGRGEVVYVMAQMLLHDNALEVVNRIQDTMPSVERTLPEGVRIIPIYDRSQLVVATLKTVARNLAEGGALVVLVLLLTLGSIRAGLVVASVIPLAMIGAATCMRLFGIPGNLMSLGALDFGLIVDGAVVLVEHAFHARLTESRRPEENESDWLARTCASVARPTLFAMLTISLVYVPVVALTGVDGKMFRPMALVVLFALGTALILSLTFVPAALSAAMRGKWPTRGSWVAKLIARFYPQVLARVQRRGAWIAGVALVTLGVGGFVLSRLGAELAPTLDEGDLVIQTTRSPDIHLSSAIEDATRFERAARGVPEIRQIVSRIGSPAVATDIMGIEQGDVFVRLAPHSEWRSGLTREALINQISARVREQDPNVELSFTQPIQMRFNELLGGSVTDVSVSVFTSNLDELRRLAERIAQTLAHVPHAVDVRVLAPTNVQVVSVVPDPVLAASYGLSGADVLATVRAAQTGIEAGSTSRGPQTIPLLVRLGAVDSLSGLSVARTTTSRGGLVTLAQVASIQSELAPGIIQHRDGERRLMVGFNVRGADLGSVVDSAQAAVERALRGKRGFRLEWGGQAETLDAARARLALVIPIVAVLILALMYFVLRNAKLVTLLMIHVPFACVGGVVGLAARGLSMSVSASIGFIALSGIAVMNGMVLLVRTQHASASEDAAQRIAEAAVDRARPVLMTALVAALGFVPMMFATGIGSEVQRPLATVVVCGLVTSTFTTLVLMPSVFPWFFRRKAA